MSWWRKKSKFSFLVSFSTHKLLNFLGFLTQIFPKVAFSFSNVMKLMANPTSCFQDKTLFMHIVVGLLDSPSSSSMTFTARTTFRLFLHLGLMVTLTIDILFGLWTKRLDLSLYCKVIETTLFGHNRLHECTNKYLSHLVKCNWATFLYYLWEKRSRCWMHPGRKEGGGRVHKLNN